MTICKRLGGVNFAKHEMRRVMAFRGMLYMRHMGGEAAPQVSWIGWEQGMEDITRADRLQTIKLCESRFP